MALKFVCVLLLLVGVVCAYSNQWNYDYDQGRSAPGTEHVGVNGQNRGAGGYGLGVRRSQGFGNSGNGFGGGNQGFGGGNPGFDSRNQGFGQGNQGFGQGYQGFGQHRGGYQEYGY